METFLLNNNPAHCAFEESCGTESWMTSWINTRRSWGVKAVLSWTPDPTLQNTSLTTAATLELDWLSRVCISRFVKCDQKRILAPITNELGANPFKLLCIRISPFKTTLLRKSDTWTSPSQVQGQFTCFTGRSSSGSREGERNMAASSYIL